MGTINSSEDLEKEWSTVPCNCGSEVCTGAFIEPDIVSYQGTISIYNAEHIVELHNTWLKEKQQ